MQSRKNFTFGANFNIATSPLFGTGYSQGGVPTATNFLLTQDSNFLITESSNNYITE